MPYYNAYDSFKTKKSIEKNNELKKKHLVKKMKILIILLLITVPIMVL